MWVYRGEWGNILCEKSRRLHYSAACSSERIGLRVTMSRGWSLVSHVKTISTSTIILFLPSKFGITQGSRSLGFLRPSNEIIFLAEVVGNISSDRGGSEK